MKIEDVLQGLKENGFEVYQGHGKREESSDFAPVKESDKITEVAQRASFITSMLIGMYQSARCMYQDVDDNKVLARKFASFINDMCYKVASECNSLDDLLETEIQLQHEVIKTDESGVEVERL
jgi:hypothetical protein